MVSRSIKKKLWKSGRSIAVLLVNTMFRRLLFVTVRPRFVFAVYGNEPDESTYAYRWTKKLLPPIVSLGIIRVGKCRGLLIASKFYEHELASDSNKVRRYMSDLNECFPSIQRVALVGRLPNFVMRAGHRIEEPYVDGSTGTRYMLYNVAKNMRNLSDYQNENSITVLGGAGRIGSEVCNDLVGIYDTVIAFDPRYEENEIIIRGESKIIKTSDPSWFSECKLYIGLTHHGDAIKGLSSYIPAGSLIADDTHPCISLKVRETLACSNIRVLKVVLSHSDYLAWPRFPSWSRDSVPGCLMEALVLSIRPDITTDDVNAFWKISEEIGFKGVLVEPLAE